MEITLNLGKRFFVHSFLVIQDEGDKYETLVLGAVEYLKEKFWIQNFQVYISNSPDYAENAACPGGPFMKVDESSSYNNDHHSWDRMWNYGSEIWCNLEGQYVSLVADLTVL